MFKVLSLLSMTEIRTKDKVIYLTFDDGPEPGITEAVLNLLIKHDAKATFFCTGKNFEKYPELVQLILDNGHTFGNHSYSHLNGLKENFQKYIDDVTKGKEVIQSSLFRPPWGLLTIDKFIKIRKSNRLILWSISSKDFEENVNIQSHCQNMINQTRPGSIVLFHFSQKHAIRTMEILPIYLAKINELNYMFHCIPDR